MSDITCRRPITWRSCAKTDVGTVREANEDSVISMPNRCLWAVADGMGGHAVGDVASSKVVAALEFMDDQDRISTFVNTVEDRLISVNEQLIEYADIMLEDATIGSTVVALLIKDRVGVCLWVGDSRLYRYRNYELAQLSRDHSQVEEMLQMGLLTPEEAENHPQGNVITRAIGVESPLYVDINAFSTQIGDTFLLCSDGLYNAVPEAEIVSSLAIRDVEECAQDLINKALESGAKDNVSVIVVRGEPGKFESPGSNDSE
ncbi:PP2C family protein-serine/threonine phosphatase [Teredinibacter sp. KSP-S5-2]|uniref:PP2C family protein-serine/threonine phosphatase n=1 Tax=Teredinibacter sp. KSP-S5-2 TaxID=3034506 RepID=UPI0029342ADF|nr:protein phosphatase 2C domain-containing protein [Teredinibacter sp. KSP-S5-2]WNO08062.1 protein phosphatase 2C domain-containing protein [Teredinibacter sp. KSP-S5-2]